MREKRENIYLVFFSKFMYNYLISNAFCRNFKFNDKHKFITNGAIHYIYILFIKYLAGNSIGFVFVVTHFLIARPLHF